jgi:zinc protease
LKPPLHTTAVIALALMAVGPRPGQAAPVARRQVLANGLEIIVVESRMTPLVSLAVAVRPGRMAEGPKDSGLTHLLEHTLFRPNQALPSGAPLAARKRDLGVALIGGTEESVMYVGFTTPATQLDGALQLLRDMVVSPRFDETALAAEKRLIALEGGHRSGDDHAQRADRLDRILWWKYPGRKTELLERENLPSLTVADLQRSKDRYLVPDNAALVVVGYVDAAAVLDRAGQLFGSWKRSGAKGPDVNAEALRHPPLPRSQVVVEPVQSPFVAGAFVWHGPSTTGPEATLADAAQLLSAAFQIESSGRDRLREACDSLNLSYAPSANVGEFTVHWTSVPERADGCILAILQELPATARALTDDDLKAALPIAEGEILRAREQAEDLARDLARTWASGDLSRSLDLLAKLGAVERGDIARLVDRFVEGRPFLLSVHLPQSQIDRGLDLRHFEALVSRRPPPRSAR